VRILLDESVPRRFGDLIVGHTVTTAVDRGWSGLKNGELLERAQSEFDVLITVDRNLLHQQDLRRYSVLVVVLVARTNRLQDLRPLIPTLLSALDRPQVSPVVLEADRT
jgi:hypothetical protein